jgi:hypothetical protein
LFSFSQTSYCQLKIEKAVHFYLLKKHPKNKLKGLKMHSFNRWHIDEFALDFGPFGHYEAVNIFCEFKGLKWLFGKIQIENLVVEKLILTQEKPVPLSAKIFNTLYLNQKIDVNQLHIDHLEIPLLETPLAINFVKKAHLNFLDLFDLEMRYRSCFEIPRKYAFLKFKSDFQFNGWKDLFIDLKGEGYIKDSGHLKLQGMLKLPYSEKGQNLELSMDLDEKLFARGYLFSDALEGNFTFSNETIKSQFNILDFKALWPKTLMDGQLNIEVFGPPKSLAIKADSSKLYYKRKALAPLNIEIPKLDKSYLHANAFFLKETPYATNIECLYQKLDFKNCAYLKIKGEPCETQVNFTFDQKEILDLKLHTQIHDLKFFEGFFHKLELSGEGNIVVNFSKQTQTKELFSAFSNVKIGHFYCDHGDVSFSESENLGKLTLKLDQLSTPFSEPVSAYIHGDKTDKWELLTQFKSPYTRFQSNQEILFHPYGYKICLNAIEGTSHGEPIKLKKPIQLFSSKEGMKLDTFYLDWGKTTLCGEGEKTGDILLLKLKVEDFPLKGLKNPYFETVMDGNLGLNIDINSTKFDESLANFTIENLSLDQTNQFLRPIFIKGQGNFDLNRVKYTLNTYFSKDDFCYMQGDLPLALCAEGLKADKNSSQRHFISIKYDIKDLGRLLNMGSNSLGGYLKGDICVYNSAKAPSFITGNIDIENLHAGFPLLGLYLDNGNLKMKPEGTLAPFSLDIHDLQDGKAQVLGALNLTDFSYWADAKLDSLFINFKRIFESNLTGDLSCQGDLKQIKSEGSLAVTRAKYELVHNKIKKAKTYIIEKQSEDLPLKKPTAFKYCLNYQLIADDPIKIRGIGLDSDWRGSSHCHIANQKFSLKGLLDCAKGEYRFNSKKFIIDEGIIHLSDQNLSTILAKGHLDIPSYQIKVNLLGPLSSPKLHFSSLPQMSQNAIFSQILFNKPITDLHPFQSLELAQTLMELSGDKSPFSLAKLRSNLSIDTLDIQSGDGDKNNLILHIGKYLRPGFLVGLSQSASKSNMLLQLELKHGFLLKAESKEQKDGKFSLKWNKSF